MKKSLLVFVLLAGSAVPAYLHSRAPRPAVPDPDVTIDEHDPFGQPVTQNAPTVRTTLKRIGYVTCLDHEWKVPAWVSYRVAKEYFAPEAPKFDRPGSFKPDPDLPEEVRVTAADYTGTGYDRGHMAPNAAMNGRSLQCIEESFYMSNIAPQTPSLNRRIWKNLEERVREWGVKYGEIWVIVGPIFDGGKPTGQIASKVAIPTHCYMVIYRRDGAHVRAMAFVIANQKENFPDDADFAPYLTTIDEIESKTGLDLLRGLEDGEENRVEAAREGLWE